MKKPAERRAVSVPRQARAAPIEAPDQLGGDRLGEEVRVRLEIWQAGWSKKDRVRPRSGPDRDPASSTACSPNGKARPQGK
jgi:hypothetical protein